MRITFVQRVRVPAFHPSSYPFHSLFTLPNRITVTSFLHRSTDKILISTVVKKTDIVPNAARFSYAYPVTYLEI